MPKKSTKSKSKRVTLKQKYKVLRKVREHHRKTRKEAKKLGLKKRAPKDPGIPNAWPFKQELIQQLAAQKERAAEHMRKVKEESWKRAQEVRAVVCVGATGRRGGLLAGGTFPEPGTGAAVWSRCSSPTRSQALRLDGEDTMANVSYDAAERAAAFEARGSAVAGAAQVQDYSRRAYYKDFVKVRGLGWASRWLSVPGEACCFLAVLAWCLDEVAPNPRPCPGHARLRRWPKPPTSFWRSSMPATQRVVGAGTWSALSGAWTPTNV